MVSAGQRPRPRVPGPVRRGVRVEPRPDRVPNCAASLLSFGNDIVRTPSLKFKAKRSCRAQRRAGSDTCRIDSGLSDAREGF